MALGLYEGNNPVYEELKALSPAAKQAVLAGGGAPGAGPSQAPTPMAPPTQAIPPASLSPSPSAPPSLGTLHVEHSAVSSPQLPHFAGPVGPDTMRPDPTGSLSLGEPSAPPTLAPMAHPAIQAPRGTLEGDQAHRSELEAKPAALESVYHDIANSGFGKAHPFLGHLLGGLAQIPSTALDIGLSAGVPHLGMMIPGTSLQRGTQIAGTNKEITQEQGERENAAKTGLENAQTANLPQARDLQRQQIEGGLAEHGLKLDDQGKIVPVPDEELSPALRASLQGGWKPVTGVAGPNGEPMEANEKTGLYRVAPGSNGSSVVSTDKTSGGAKGQLQQQIADAFKKGDQATVTRLQAELKAIDPAAAERMAITIRGQNMSESRAEKGYSRQDVREHDKAYVQPAEAIEKSYDMMDNAYKEYEAAKAQGKELPTGAQSMLALSTHLATTFGNVKGARVTKDMIAEHLGARSIGDDALVAIQRLTNGDRLSPAQWDAFHSLIGQSRKLTWQTATKEAERKGVPIDFLPPDLKTMHQKDGDYSIDGDPTSDTYGQYIKAGK